MAINYDVWEISTPETNVDWTFVSDDFDWTYDTNTSRHVGIYNHSPYPSDLNNIGVRSLETSKTLTFARAKKRGMWFKSTEMKPVIYLHFP
jgi:hypothetical protein